MSLYITCLQYTINIIDKLKDTKCFLRINQFELLIGYRLKLMMLTKFVSNRTIRKICTKSNANTAEYYCIKGTIKVLAKKCTNVLWTIPCMSLRTTVNQTSTYTLHEL